MRKKELKLILTFYTTADAMAMEQACKDQDAPGRLIPVPESISAGCGLAWCAELTDLEKLQEVLGTCGVEAQDVQECII